jgi:disulfide bond formation protein DsbB
MIMNTIWQYRLNALFIIVLGSVLMAAFGYQAITHEAPCPLCLLQRLGMIGITVGCMLNLRFGTNTAHYGLMLFSALFGGAVSLRQIGLHVCPQFQTFGEPVLGLDLYAWALVVFAASILATAALLYMHGVNKDKAQHKPTHSTFHKIAFIYIVLITIAEVITTFQLCGFSACQG